MRPMTSAIEFPAPVIGLMSGTSVDGVDAALLTTDGETMAEAGTYVSQPYSDGLRADILALMRGKGDQAAVAQALTEVHYDAVEALIASSGIARTSIKLIGFHGQTILHKPDEGYTLQIGTPDWLAKRTGIPVVADFRSNDVKHGGQGAPLVPLFHQALAHDLPKPLMVVNIGGVANITWLGENGAIRAFDCGPGNALLDDWMGEHTGARCDHDGTSAANGKINNGVVNAFLAHPFFTGNNLRALDRNEFNRDVVNGLSVESGAATLTAMTAAAIAHATTRVPDMPERLLICGGGRHNPTLMKMIAQYAQVDVQPVEAVGWNGDMLEAQAFAYLAARSVRGLPLSLPETTGVRQPVTGGVFYPV